MLEKKHIIVKWTVAFLIGVSIICLAPFGGEMDAALVAFFMALYLD